MKFTLLLLALSVVYADLPPSCIRPIYCNSKVLHYVQLARIFEDSKTFVDLRMKNDEETIIKDFDVLLNSTQNQPTQDDIRAFIDQHFSSVSELENWVPSDYNENPAFLANIKDSKLREFGREINKIWLTLGRKVKSEVIDKPELFSIVPTHHGFIIPGGRFKELYYWDTYWIIEGLLVSGMEITVKGVIENLIELQRKFGHIPNGARWYYQERSQPPLLSAMVSLYVQATNDLDFLRANIDALEDELEYWLDTQTVVFTICENEYTLLRYFSPSQGPRPESYYEDYSNAQVFKTEDDQTQFYVELKSGAETGWDFSSRWYIDKDGDNKGNLTNIHTTSILPVDLNAIFANAMQNVAFFHTLLQNGRKGTHWAHLAKQWRNTIKEVLWNEQDGIWYDWDLENSRHRKYFFPSNVAPLWMNALDRGFVKVKANKIVDYLKRSHGLEFPGGVPTSLSRTGEQWDFPNAWPPLVSMMINALEAIETPESDQLAFEVAQTWVRSNYQVFANTKQMFEKYDAETPGKVGGGGEYTVQTGFGWSNGVILELLAKYGQVLTAQDPARITNTYHPFYRAARLMNPPLNGAIPGYWKNK